MNVILLHGALGCMEQFSELKEYLSPQYIVHAFNFSGHGGKRIEGTFSTDLFVKDTLAFMDDHKLDTAHFFGHSMGGYIALKLARDHPHRVEKIITLGTKFDWTKESADRETKMLVPDVIEAKHPKFAELLKNRHHPEDWKNIMRQTVNMMIDLGNGAAMNQADFNRIQNEILICLGAEDNMVTKDESEKIITYLKNGHFKLMEGAKHPFEAVNKIELSDLIKSFLTPS